MRSEKSGLSQHSLGVVDQVFGSEGRSRAPALADFDQEHPDAATKMSLGRVGMGRCQNGCAAVHMSRDERVKHDLEKTYREDDSRAQLCDLNPGEKILRCSGSLPPLEHSDALDEPAIAPFQVMIAIRRTNQSSQHSLVELIINIIQTPGYFHEAEHFEQLQLEIFRPQ